MVGLIRDYSRYMDLVTVRSFELLEALSANFTKQTLCEHESRP